ncbi:DUF2911 domain-containing protein [Tellurirhabdus rosea]|uniref:DUF2911 domain-containing protein n=1 Tax=Tellurirhabdus rosea TaxID=2674997 RepID=UPI002256180C|nr:DUF2911 domain-containing protein [Tellurirhabdus rosea]
MKRSLALIALFLITTVSFVFAQGTPPSPRVKLSSPNKNVSVDYGQPSKRGRQIFGALVPYGQVWRTGANEATTITFAKDVTFGGKAVKAGTYTLFTVPTEKEWTVILNSKTGLWGAYDYEKVKGQNVAEVKVPAKSAKSVVEKMTITPENNEVTIAWDQMTVSIPVKEGSTVN